MARVLVEPPPGWEPAQLVIASLWRLGYTVQEGQDFGPDGSPLSILIIR